MFIPKKIPG